MSTYNRKIPHLFLSEPGWRKRRKEILRREPMCRPCAELGYATLATAVDHIIPRARGGKGDVSNLQPICEACHKAKTGRETHGGIDNRQAVCVTGSLVRKKDVELAPRRMGTSPRAGFLNRSRNEEK